jgi:NADPH:quinone reductase and related Zn-dependent oxidoreductases
VGNPAKVDFARSEGYDEVIVRGPGFAEKLRAALNERPLHLLMDSVGGEYFSIPFSMLAPMGRAVVFGSARYAQTADRPNRIRLLWQFLNRPKVDPQRLIETNRAVMGFNLIWLYKQAGLMHQLLTELETLKLKPPHVGHRFPFEQLPDAVRLFQTGRTVGKVVVLVEEV